LDSLLARFAENSFWMARYMERAENLARILDVNETFAQNKEGVKEWLPIVQLHDDAERFFSTHEGGDRRSGAALLRARPEQPDLDRRHRPDGT
jgi:uncharacterized alpha-E superfamily protein